MATLAVIHLTFAVYSGLRNSRREITLRRQNYHGESAAMP
jgi:hypothetical protein